MTALDPCFHGECVRRIVRGFGETVGGRGKARVQLVRIRIDWHGRSVSTVAAHTAMNLMLHCTPQPGGGREDIIPL